MGWEYASDEQLLRAIESVVGSREVASRCFWALEAADDEAYEERRAWETELSAEKRTLASKRTAEMIATHELSCPAYRQRWTAEEVAVLNDHTLDNEQVAERLGRSVPAVHKARLKYGERGALDRAVSAEFHTRGLCTVREAADRLGVRKGVVEQYCRDGYLDVVRVDIPDHRCVRRGVAVNDLPALAELIKDGSLPTRARLAGEAKRLAREAIR